MPARRTTRRDFLTVGALTPLGVSLSGLLQQETLANTSRRPKSCILLWMFGGPSHIDMYDLCLLYTSDAADDTPCVDLGGRRIIKK